MCVLASALWLGVLWPSARALAQESEEAGTSRGGYAWGEAAEDESPREPSAPAVHRYGRIFASLGVGFTVRIIDFDVPLGPMVQDRAAPIYLPLRGGWFFEGDGDIQHGVALGLSPNLTPDGAPPPGIGVDTFAQWAITPTYIARWWLSDWVQPIAHFGISIVPNSEFTTWGLELGLGAIIKVFAGAGFYAEATFSNFFGAYDTWHPLISGEVGLVFDYEVLP